MENTEITQPVSSQLSFNDQIRDYLLETSKWGKFLAIVGYVGMGLLVLMGLGVAVASSVLSEMAATGLPLAVLGVVYIVIAVLYFFPINYLYKFSVNMRKGLVSTGQDAVNEGFKNLKSLFRFMGIMTVVVLSIYALAIVIAIPVMIFVSR